MSGATLTAQALIALAALVPGTGGTGPAGPLPGRIATARRGQGQELADLREYAPGDDLRELDPSASARTGVPHIRTRRQERDQLTLLIADFRRPMLWGLRRALRSVAAAEALALTGWQAAARGGRIGALVLTPGARLASLPARPERQGMLGAIGALVQGHQAALTGGGHGGGDTVQPLDRALDGLLRLAPRGAQIVLASALDLPGAGFAPLLARARAEGRAPRILLIGEEDPAHLPPGDYPVGLPGGLRMRLRPGALAAPPPLPVPPGVAVLRLDPAWPAPQVAALLAAPGDERRRA